MNRAWTQVVGIIGALIVGLLIGSWLGGSSVLWWLIIGLGVVAFSGGIVVYLTDKSRASQSKPLAKV